DIRRFSAANLKKHVRCSERSWNRVDGQPAGAHRYVIPSARGHDVAIVSNGRDGRKVIFFSGGAYGNIATTDRLLKSAQRGVRNPAPRRSDDGATDRPGRARQR